MTARNWGRCRLPVIFLPFRLVPTGKRRVFFSSESAGRFTHRLSIQEIRFLYFQQSQNSRDGAHAEFRILSMVLYGTLETFFRTGFFRFQKHYMTSFSPVGYDLHTQFPELSQQGLYLERTYSPRYLHDSQRVRINR